MTYDTVLKAERREAHARTAAWLAARVGDREAEYLAVTAEHYERAGDQVRALDWYERAAASAEARFANEAAWTYLERMLAMPGLADSPRRWEAARHRVVADLIADRARHRAAVEEAMRLAEALDDDALRATAAMSQALLADRLGDRARPAGMRNAPPSWPNVPTRPPPVRWPTPSWRGWRASAATWPWRITISSAPCRWRPGRRRR